MTGRYAQYNGEEVRVLSIIGDQAEIQWASGSTLWLSVDLIGPRYYREAEA